MMPGQYKLFVSSLLMSCMIACGNEPTDTTSADVTRTAPAEAQPPLVPSPTSLPQDEEALKTQLENGLLPAVIFEGEQADRFTIEDRMELYGVTAVSIAYAKDGRLIWAEGYGDGITSDTRFQAASLSKAAAATGIVTFALDNDIDLDADVNDLIPEFDLAAVNPVGSTVSIRKLLAHTAGATVGGFPGYGLGDDVPSNLDVIAGAGPANTDPVIIEPDPDRAFRYSGGGFQIAQAVVEAQSGEPFELTMDRLLLAPVGMKASTFEMWPPGTSVSDVATATTEDGTPLDGGWHVFPEQAAAGLWTTPADYLRFVLALMKANEGDTTTGIRPEVARQILAAESESYGLGIGVQEMDGRVFYQHGGANRGYRCFFIAVPDTGQAFIVMTNSSNGQAIALEIMRAASDIYNLPGEEPETVTRIDLDAETLQSLSGGYALPGQDEPFVSVEAGDGVLTGSTIQGETFTLLPIGDDIFIDPRDGERIAFREEDGVMSAIAGSTVLPRVVGP